MESAIFWAREHNKISLQNSFIQITAEAMEGQVTAAVGRDINETVDLGVIIHENRFTFEQRGLVKVLDLGEYWEKETGSPIPLGGIAMKRDKDEAMKLKVDRIIKRSVEFAMDNPASSKEYVQELAQEMDERVIEQHIALYVNEYSVDLGEEGRAAVLCLFEKAIELNIFERSQLELILTTNKS